MMMVFNIRRLRSFVGLLFAVRLFGANSQAAEVDLEVF